MTNSQRQTQWQRNNRAKGLCGCGKPRAFLSLTCEPCLKYKRERAKREYQLKTHRDILTNALHRGPDTFYKTKGKARFRGSV